METVISYVDNNDNNINTLETFTNIIENLNDTEADSPNLIVPKLRRVCVHGHTHVMSICIWCGSEDVYREYDLVDNYEETVNEDGQPVKLDIKTGKKHNCAARNVILEYYKDKTLQEILDPDFLRHG